MYEKIVAIFLSMLVIATTLSAAQTTDTSVSNNSKQPLTYIVPFGSIYVNTSAIDARTDLNDTQKIALKSRILQHLRNNFNNAVGASNVTITNDPTEAANANRTIQIDPGHGNPPNKAWGCWPHGSNTTYVYLGVFMNYSLVNNSFKNTDETWNTTRLGNAIGHTAGHEVGHSFSIGHNHETSTSGPGGNDNRSKMTVGSYINASTRANVNFLFDNHSRNVLRLNWGRGACSSVPDYDELVLLAHHWDEPNLTDLPDELGTLDAIFYHFAEVPGWYELGILGEDTDNGIIDGNPDFDFIYKSSLQMDNTDAEFISFLKDNHEHTSWLLRGTEESTYPGDWFMLDPDDVILEEWIEQPDGTLVARFVNMSWPDQGVNITLDSYSFGNESCPYNGFTYELLHPPEAPNINGPTQGMVGTPYEYTFFSEDLDGDELYYYVDWGDGISTGWIGPYPAGDMVTLNHTWFEQDTYNISAKAKDTYDLESDWATLEVNIPENKVSISTPILKFLQNHPHIFQMLGFDVQVEEPKLEISVEEPKLEIQVEEPELEIQVEEPELEISVEEPEIDIQVIELKFEVRL